MAAKQEQGKTGTTGGHTRFTIRSSQTPCPAGARRRASRLARIAALQLLLVLTVLNAPPAFSQPAPAITGNTESGTSWAPAGEFNDIGVRAVGATSKPLPKITITASRDTIFGGLEDLRFVLERDQAGDSMTVKLWLHQDEDWLDRRTQTRYVYFNPNETTAVLRVHRSKFNAGVTSTGCILAKVLEVSGQDYSSKKVRAGVWVVSSPDPLIKLFVGREVFSDAEDAGQLAGTHVVAVMAEGMYRGVSLFARISTRGKGSQPGLTATPGEDYKSNIRAARIDESSFKRYDGTWVGGGDFVVPILDDNLREGDEIFEIVLEPDPELAGLVRYEQVHEWTECGSGCVHRVNITDNEEMPALDLSVSEDAIMEEGETSSIAMVSITDGARFADDQVLTLELGGTATMNADYTVAPADADRAMPGYQRVLPARSTAIGVALRAMSDDVDDPGEMIEVSAALNGDAIGQMQAIEIMNQEVAKPRITLAANSDNIIAGLEDLEFTLTREGPVDQSLTLTVLLAQDQRWIPFNSCPVTFAAGQSTATATLRRSQFSGAVVESGQLTASVQAIEGYDVDGAEAAVFVVSQAGAAVTVSFGEDAYRFAENRGDQFVTVVAQAAAGMPRGAAVRFSVTSRNGTAKAGEDFQRVSETITLAESDFALDHGSWRAQRRLAVRLLDDQVREGAESFDIQLGRASGQSDEVEVSSSAAAVQITDDEDIPRLDLSVSARDINEENQTSANVSVAIGNGKTFATDEILTFAFAGSATRGDDYEVAPADADAAASGHQVALRAGSKSAKLTLTARRDDVADPDERIEVSVTHAGDAIGSESIRIQDHRPVLGPTVEITFEGVQGPPNQWVKGTATGPFTARFTFSEPVRDFEQWQIHWNTHAETTVDGTPISVLFWDFTEVRRGLEYSVRIMPAQNGILWIGVREGKVTSVSTGATNKLSISRVQVAMPPGRMLVAPTELTLDEGDPSGAEFVVVLTSASSGAVTVTTSGMEGTQVNLDRPTVTFSHYWNSGRVVKATAAADADRKDETVTLTLSASGGGYDGQSANVVVTVRDNQSGSGSDVAGDVADEASDLILVEGLSPEAATAALFGEKTLSEARRVALDRLGNRNGTYDLGDVLSWIERCRQGRANCGETTSDASKAIAGAAGLAVVGQLSRSRQRQRGPRSGQSRSARLPRHRTRRRADDLRRRRSSRAWYGVALLLCATITWGCADDFAQPPVEPDPGPLTVWLNTSHDGRDHGAMLLVEGPGIESVQAPGLEVFQSGNSSSKQIVVSGELSSGPVLELQVPDRALWGQYRVRLLQVAGDDYSLRDLSEYSTAIVRLGPGTLSR